MILIMIYQFIIIIWVLNQKDKNQLNISINCQEIDSLLISTKKLILFWCSKWGNSTENIDLTSNSISSDVVPCELDKGKKNFAHLEVDSQEPNKRNKEGGVQGTPTNQSGRKIIRLKTSKDKAQKDTKPKEKIQKEAKPVKSKISQDHKK